MDKFITIYLSFLVIIISVSRSIKWHSTHLLFGNIGYLITFIINAKYLYFVAGAKWLKATWIIWLVRINAFMEGWLMKVTFLTLHKLFQVIFWSLVPHKFLIVDSKSFAIMLSFKHFYLVRKIQEVFHNFCN